ncbi:MAG: biotin--[acetyl-CoA-carboxylase] ligase [Methylobacteriaceae bacterium]|nr:biotin--[acetyl-CoA-carboxylase] ligase [Methylobacteriaceae bacterium]
MSAFALSPDAAQAGYRLAAFETIGSTSTEASRLGRAGETGPLWIVSTHQTEGRGRQGRRWETPAGNLAASLLLTLDLPPARIATLGFVAGVAVTEALDEVAGGHSACRLKWPNDVLAGGAKLVGISLESEARPDGSRFVTVGIGVNVVGAPAGLPYPATSLAALGITARAAEVFAALSRRWLARYADWLTEGFAPVRERWLARAAGLGGPTRVVDGGRERSGRFETLDDDGQLVLRCPNGGALRVSAGDVHFGVAGTLRQDSAA